jgi:hypothetical protein
VDREALATFWVFRLNRWVVLGALGLFGLALLLPIRLLPAAGPGHRSAIIAQGVFLWGHDFSGQTAEEARQNLQVLAHEIDRAPVDAQVMMSDGVSYVTPEQNGWTLDVEQTLFKLTAAGEGGVVRPVLKAKAPAHKLSDYPDSIIRQAGTSQQALGLLFNVDWGEKELGAILPILKAKGAHVTFFVSGRWAQKNPDLVRQMVSDGHEIASHGYDLSYGPMDLARAGRLKGDIAQSVSTIQGITKKPVHYWAPHMSEVSPEIVKTASALRLRTVLYSIDTIDWRADATPQSVMAKVQSAKAGDLILMHPKPVTVNILPALLQRLQENGLQPVTLSQLLSGGSGGPTETGAPLGGH